MKKILIVDDAPIMRLMIKDILEANGFEILGEAENGKQAVEMCEALKPNVVTLDIVMPEMDGIETLRNIKEKYKDIKVVMVTAIDQKKYLLEAIRLGASDYIVKPFDDQRVVSTIKKVLKEG